MRLNGSNTGVQLTDNDIYNDGDYGIYLDGANDIVSGNMVTGGEYQEYGVYVDGPHYSISGNTVSGVYYGIYSLITCGTISGNTVSGSSNTGITAYGDGRTGHGQRQHGVRQPDGHQLAAVVTTACRKPH